MSCEIEPHEVLAYLNELGYTNISAQQFKEFIKDLKKLIKYDFRIRELRENLENVPPQESNVFQTLYETGTVASKAKEIPRKDKVITVQIKKPRPRIAAEVNGSQSESSVASISQAPDCMDVTGSSNTDSNCDGAYVDKTRPKSSHEVDRVRVHSGNNELRPKASFIRPRMNVRPSKSDPVALYHQYQAEWKKQKFPGEDNHSNLRWAVREKMLGEPAQVFYPATSNNVLSRKRSNSRRM